MPRDLHLYPDRQRGSLVQSLRSVAEVTKLTGFQNDTLRLMVHGGITTPDPAVVSVTSYVEKPWSFDSIRASISLIDATTKSTDVAPERGKFKLAVEDEQTDWIDWPTPAGTALTAGEIAAFRTAVLAALNALTTVSGDLEAADASGAPVHTLSFAWTDADKTTPIEVSGLRLIPPVEDEVGVVQASPYVQYVKLTQLPIVITDAFEFPAPAVVAVTEERAGGAGVNAVQLVTIPEDGAFDLEWNGSNRTAVLSCASLTAATLASALNALPIAGLTDTAPAFEVSARGTRAFAVQFIGVLAESTQALLSATMRQAASSLVAVSEMLLTSKRFERALAGGNEKTFRFELVIGTAENTFQADFVMTNDATGPGTVQSAEEQLAVVNLTNTVYVPADTLSSFATVGMGKSFTPPGAIGANTHQSVTHNLGTQDISVLVVYADPASPYSGKKRTLKEGEFSWRAVTDNTAEVWFPFPISATEEDDTYFGKFKVFVQQLDATLQLLGGIVVTGDQVMIGSDTLTTVLTTINNALGIYGSNVQIPAGNITGLLTGDQIDVASVIAKLAALFPDNETVRAAFTSLLTTSILNNPAFLTDLTRAILNTLANTADLNSLFIAQILEALSSIQSGGLVNGITQIPAFELTVPVPTAIDGPKKRVPQVVTEKTTTTTGTTSVERTLSRTEDVEVATTLYIYGALSRAKTTLSDGGTKSNVLLEVEDGTEGTYYTVSGANVSAAAVEGRPAIKFADGDIITVLDGHWCKMVLIGGVYYPAELERVLFNLTQNSKMFTAGSGWNIQNTAGFVLSSASGTTTGRITLVVETGVYTPSGAAPHLASIDWTARASIDLPLTNAPLTLPYSVKMTRPDGGTYTGKVKLGATETTFTPDTADIAVRARVTKFDLLDASDAYGAIGIKNTGTASLVQL